jgi:DNA-binding HxlR family transcriptional regulator
MPEPPPVMRMVFPVVFMVVRISWIHSRIVSNQWEVGTRKIYTYPKESEGNMRRMVVSETNGVGRGKGRPVTSGPPAVTDPKLDALVREIIERVADKWTMLVLEVLEEHGVVRFTRLGELVGDISQKMLTKTVRQMERDGLVTRTVHPVIPPRVEYQLTELGHSLGAAFCGVWIWAEEHGKEIERARARFDGGGVRRDEL